MHAMNAAVEMRKENRYRLDAPAHFTWGNGQQPQRVRGEGVTRDISLLGAFILAPSCPPVGSSIRLEIVLPSQTGMKPPIRFRGGARVVRVERVSDGRKENGFAIVSKDCSEWRLARSRKKSPPQWRRTVAARGNFGVLPTERAAENHCC
jgi:hypothetical protein